MELIKNIDLRALLGGGILMSRSEAKRALVGSELFKTILLDFSVIDFIGPSFADEMFRVFTNYHPEIVLIPQNINPDIDRMIKRAMVANKIPNRKTIIAMQDADSGKIHRAKNVDEIFQETQNSKNN